MSYTTPISHNNGTPGLTIRGALFSGSVIHATVRDQAVTEVGQGHYLWIVTAPDGYVGSAVFYTGTLAAAADFAGVVIKAQAGIEPPAPSAATNATAVRAELGTELGRMDVAVSTRLAAGSYAAAPSAATVAGAVRTELGTELGRIDVAISSVDGGLSGPSAVTLIFEDAAGDPVPLVDFVIVGQGPGRAGTDGVAEIGLADGTYTVLARASGMLFVSTELTVDGDTALTLAGTAVVAPVPSAPGKAVIHGTLRDPAGAVVANATVIFTLVLLEPGVAGDALIVGRQITGKTNASGLMKAADGESVLELTRTDAIEPEGAVWRATCEAAKLKETFELEAGSMNITELAE